MKDQSAFEELVSRYIDGQANREEVARLNERLRADPAARRKFTEILNLDSALGANAANWAPSPEGSPERRFVARARQWFRNLDPTPRRIAFVTASTAALFVAGWFWSNRSPAKLARLTDSAEAVWAHDTLPPAPGANLGRGKLNLQSGAAQITFRSGVVLTLTAPAEIEMQSPSQVGVRRGSISLYVPEAGRGFSVISPGGKVVDLGTEFALDVDAAGRSQVRVLNGSVQLERARFSPAGAARLSAGYSARVDRSAPAQITQVPLLIDRFEAPSGAALNFGLPGRQREGGIAVHYRDLTPGTPSQVLDGMLAMPFEMRAGLGPGNGGVVLARDFQELAGRRYTVAFRAYLPEMGQNRAAVWVSFVLWDGEEGNELPMAYESPARLAVLLSPDWQVAVRTEGHGFPTEGANFRVFKRSSAAGPYQVVLTVDETASTGPVADVMVNGVKICSSLPVRLGKSRFLGFRTYSKRSNDGRGLAQIDDLTISVDPGDDLAEITLQSDTISRPCFAVTGGCEPDKSAPQSP